VAPRAAFREAPHPPLEVHMLTRQTIGIPGLLGVLLLAAWAFCFLVLGMHGTLFHLLVPIAGLLIIVQGVLRLNTD
jgi:hypothetical protein